MTNLEMAEGLDPTQPLTDGRIWGILARPQPDDDDKNPHQDQGTFFVKPILTSRYTWTSLPITDRLSFPIQIHELPPKKDPGQLLPENSAAKILFDASNLSYKMRGDVLFSRIDGKDVDALSLSTMLRFLLRDQSTVAFAVATGMSAIHLTREVDKITGPLSLHAYFQGMKRFAVGAIGTGISPVQVTFGDRKVPPACGFCLMSKRRDGKPLRKCGRCGWRWYCGRGCQWGEWDTHKLICKRPENEQKSVVGKLAGLSLEKKGH